MKEVVLLTGVAGFIGSSLAKGLIERGYQVFGIDDLSSGKETAIPKGVEFIEGDLSKASILTKIDKNISSILHLSGQSSGEISFIDPIADLEKNTISTLNLIDFCIKNNIPKFLYASSMSVYGNVEDKPIGEDHILRPLSCYGVGKLASENYLRVFSKYFHHISLRMFNVYGPGQDLENLQQGMVSIYLSQALEKNEVIVKGGLNRFRDFIYIDDVVDSWIQIMELEKYPMKTINIGTSKRTSVSELLDLISINFNGLKIIQDSSTPGDQEGIYCDNSLLKEVIDINFTDINSGLNKFIDWAKKENQI